MWYIFTLLVGIFLGAIGMALVARNNRKKFGDTLDASRKYEERIKDGWDKYITKKDDLK